MVDYKEMFLSGLDTTTTIIIVIVVLALVGFIAYTIWLSKQYKHKVRVKEIINGRKVITDTLAREIREEKGLHYWKIKKFNEKIGLPPPEAIELCRDGKNSIEVYRTPSGEYIFLSDNGNIAEIPKEILQFKDLPTPQHIIDMPNSKEKLELLKKWKEENTKVGKGDAWRKDNNISYSFEPLTTNQRLILLDQIKKAHDKRKKSMSDLIAQAVPFLAITIILISLLVFYEDMGKPLLQMGDKIQVFHEREVEMEKIRLQQLEIMQDIKNNIQTIKGETKPPS